MRIFLSVGDPLVLAVPNCEYSCCVVPSCFILILQLELGRGAVGHLGLGREGSLLKTSAHCAERGTKLKETSDL